MGATTFMTRSKGKTPQEAFTKAVDSALYEYGHGGYSGTIAEKSEWVLIVLPAGADPADYAHKLIEENDRRVDDKWGPAGCIAVGDGEYLFFGWASC